MSSPQKTPVISEWLAGAIKELIEAKIGTARLDAEIILAHTLRKPRTYLHAHPDEPLETRSLEIADARLSLRKDRTPIAYITGHKDFYGRRFKVTPATLIPRPESETIISLLLELAPPVLKTTKNLRLVDVGTGSGALGITAKLEIPELEVTLIDTSRHALHVVSINADKHAADVTLLRSDLLSSYPFTASIIIANLPYVDPEWDRSPETDYEPAEALFAKDNGLHLINKLFKQLPERLASSGLLLLEADPRQHHIILQTASKQGFDHIKTDGLIIALQKK